MKYSIKFATPNDFTKIRLFDPHSKYINPARIRTKLQNNEIISAVENSKLVGILKFSYFWATRPCIDLIWVKKDCRNLGIGKGMLTYLEEYLRSQNHVYLFSTSEEGDSKAQAWHKKNEFKQCGKVKGLNLPHDKTAEIFFYKRISINPKSEDALPIYNI